MSCLNIEMLEPLDAFGVLNVKCVSAEVDAATFGASLAARCKQVQPDVPALMHQNFAVDGQHEPPYLFPDNPVSPHFSLAGPGRSTEDICHAICAT